MLGQVGGMLIDVVAAVNRCRAFNEILQTADCPVHVRVEVVATAEHFQDVVSASPLFRVDRMQRRLEMVEDVALLLVVQALLFGYQIGELGGGVRGRGGGRCD